MHSGIDLTYRNGPWFAGLAVCRLYGANPFRSILVERNLGDASIRLNFRHRRRNFRFLSLWFVGHCRPCKFVSRRKPPGETNVPRDARLLLLNGDTRHGLILNL